MPVTARLVCQPEVIIHDAAPASGEKSWKGFRLLCGAGRLLPLDFFKPLAETMTG